MYINQIYIYNIKLPINNRVCVLSKHAEDRFSSPRCQTCIQSNFQKYPLRVSVGKRDLDNRLLGKVGGVRGRGRGRWKGAIEPLCSYLSSSFSRGRINNILARDNAFSHRVGIVGKVGEQGPSSESTTVVIHGFTTFVTRRPGYT